MFTARYELNLYVIIWVNFSSLCRGMAQSDLSPRRPEFNPRPLHVRFLVHKVALEQVFFLIEYFGFPRSIFHQCSVLIFIYIFLLPKGQTGEAWQPSKSIAVSGTGSIGWKSCHSLYSWNFDGDPELNARFCWDLQSSNYYLMRHSTAGVLCKKSNLKLKNSCVFLSKLI